MKDMTNKTFQAFQIEIALGQARVMRKKNSAVFDKGVSMAALLHEHDVEARLKQRYGVKFLPKQVLRREMSQGFNPLSS